MQTVKALLVNKQVLLALGLIVFAGAVVASQTGAFFTAQATAQANVFTAGSLNLAIAKNSNSNTPTGGWLASQTAPWNFSNMAPGGVPSVSSVWLKNTGGVDGMHLGIAASNTSSSTNFDKQIRITQLTFDGKNLLTGGAGTTTPYVAPTNCTKTLSGSDTLTNALASASNGDVLCLTGSNYSTAWEGAPVNITKSVTIAAATGPAAQTISAGLVVDAPNVTIEGFTLKPASVLSEKAAVYFNVHDNSNSTIANNNIAGSGASGERGIIVAGGGTDGGVNITNNDIHNLTTGIYANPHTGTIMVNHNVIHDNTSGIGGFTGSDVEYNVLSNNSSEDIGGDSTTAGVTLKFNNILSPVGVAKYGAWPAYDNGGSPIVAQNNWWGSFDPSNNVRGNVDYSNFAGGPFVGFINGTDYDGNHYADLHELETHPITGITPALNAGEYKQLVMGTQIDGPTTGNGFQGASLNTDLTFTLSQN